MHPAVKAYIQKHEGTSRESFNGLSIAFLEKVWGPAFDYRFEGLEPEFPFKDFRGKQRYGDFRFQDGMERTALELDGFTTHARDLTPEEFDDHIERQNDLLLSGWHLLRFTSGMIIHKPEICQRQLLHGIGKWHYAGNKGFSTEEQDRWERRADMIKRIAFRSNGFVQPHQVAEKLAVSKQTASKWLIKLAQDGVLERVSGERRVTVYRCKGL